MEGGAHDDGFSVFARSFDELHVGASERRASHRAKPCCLTSSISAALASVVTSSRHCSV